MFTGLVAGMGSVGEVEPDDDGVRLRVDTPLAADLSPGDSIAVNGVCLTAVDPSADGFRADVMAETLRRSSLGPLGPGDPVNLELPLRASDRLGGHIVQGHVDGVGTVLRRTSTEHWDVVRIDLPERLARYVVEKGSITVDGVSLTVSALGPAADDAAPDDPGRLTDGGDRRPWFEVSLIPTTLRETTLGTRAPGDPVHLEVDVIAKYVERLLGARS